MIYFLLLLVNMAIATLTVRFFGGVPIAFSIVFQTLVSSIFYFNFNYKYWLMIFGASLVSCVIILNYYFTVDVISGLDAERYYSFISGFYSVKDTLESAIGMTLHYASLGQYRGPGSYYMFGVPVKLYLDIIGTNSPDGTILFDLTFKIMACKIIYDMLKNIDELNRTLLVCFLLASPSLNYFTVTLGKDIFAFFISVFSASLLVNTFLGKGGILVKFILVIFFLYSFTLRPYAPIVSILLALYVFNNEVSLRKAMFGSILIVFIVSLAKSKFIIFNGFIVFAFIFLTPNIFSLDNYKGFTLLPTISVLSTLVITISVLILRGNTSLRKVRFELMAIFIYSLIMTLVGYYAFTNSSSGYSLGTVGDDVFRKHILIIPFIYMLFIKLIRGNNDYL